MDDNRITIDFMFEKLSPVAIRTYNGKKVVFIVPSERLRINNFDGVIIRENAKSYEEQRRFVTDVVLTNPAEKIIVITRSPVVLSDAFACQIYTWRKAENGTRFRYVGSISTFGASPDRIALHVLRVEENIGVLANKTMDEWLNTEWTVDRIKELDEITAGIGGGWPRAKLQETLDLLEGGNGWKGK